MHTLTKTNPLKLGALFVVALLIASSWLVFPYFIQGQQLLRGVGDDSRVIKAGSVSRYLTRSLVFSKDLEITATYASDEYFQFVDRAAIVGNLRPDRNFVFFVREDIHRGALTAELPEAVLHIGDRQYRATTVSGPSRAEHHRISVFSFAKRDTDGNVIDIDTAGKMRLYVSGHYLGASQPLSFVGIWDAPYSVPDDLKSSTYITPIAILALGAGLLASVLTPCLLQLVIMFGSVVAGFSTVPGAPAGVSGRTVTPVIRKKVTEIAAVFVLGLIVLYGLAGAFIGAIGHQAQLVIGEYSRTVAVASGVIVILLGLWVGLRGYGNAACRIPDPNAIKTLSRRDAVATLIASMGFALGCTACFGGAIVGTLVVYVGAIGSATIGAGIMLSFAAGIAIPFMLSAYFLSRMNSLLEFIAGHSKKLSLASMAVIIAFGLILITDNFHVVSDMIYPYLGLS